MGRRTGIPVQAPFFYWNGKTPKFAQHDAVTLSHLHHFKTVSCVCNSWVDRKCKTNPTNPTNHASVQFKVIYLISTQHVLQFSIWKITFPYRISLLAIGSFTKCRQLSGSGGSTEVLELTIDTGSVVEKQLELPKDGCLIPKQMGISGWQMRYQPNKMQEGWYVMICIYMHVFVQYI